MDCQHTLPNDKGVCMKCGEQLETKLPDGYYEQIKTIKKAEKREGFYNDESFSE